MIKQCQITKKIKTFPEKFFKNPPEEGTEHGQNYIKSKNRHHFEKPTFWDVQLCNLSAGWFEHFKGPKNAPWLWFGHFSFEVKCCKHLQRFTTELKRPNKRQITFSGCSKCTKHSGLKVQSCTSQTVGFSKWCLFFDLMYFWPCPLPSGGFIQKNSQSLRISFD